MLNTKRALVLQAAEKYFILFTAITTICLSQYFIFPYDVSSYFFQLLIMYVFFEMIDRDYWFTLLAIAALLFLSALNRESASLSVSLLCTLLIDKWGITKKTIGGIVLLLLSFIGTYIAIRYVVSSPEEKMSMHDNVPHPLVGNNLMGLFFWMVLFFFSLLIANTNTNRYIILIFHIISLPYIFMCLKYGNAWEIRLYIPLFLSSLFLARLNIEDSKTTMLLAAIKRRWQ